MARPTPSAEGPDGTGATRRDEGVFVASIWQPDEGALVGRVQMVIGRDEPSVEVTGSVAEIAELLDRWLATFEHRGSDG